MATRRHINNDRRTPRRVLQARIRQLRGETSASTVGWQRIDGHVFHSSLVLYLVLHLVLFPSTVCSVPWYCSLVLYLSTVRTAVCATVRTAAFTAVHCCIHHCSYCRIYYCTYCVYCCIHYCTYCCMYYCACRCSYCCMYSCSTYVVIFR